MFCLLYTSARKRNAFSGVCRIYEAKNEHGQQTTGIRYRRALWLFRKGLSSGTRKDFNVEDDFLTSDDPADIR